MRLSFRRTGKRLATSDCRPPITRQLVKRLSATSLLGLCIVACGTPVASSPSSFWLGPLRDTKAASVDPIRYRGKLFAIRMTQPAGETTWIRCALEVPYRYEAVAPITKTIELPNVEATRQLLPASGEALVALLQAGTPVRLHYQIVGRFVVDTESPRSASIVCPSATHYVRSIALGTYRIIVGAEKSVNAVISADTQRDTFGRMPSCATLAPSSPKEGCTVPLAVQLSRIEGHDASAKMRTGDIAKLDHVPRAETMPWIQVNSLSSDQPQAPSQCTAGFELIGDVDQDIGMVAHSEVLTGQQGATDEQARYIVKLQAGQCYRAFGVGGPGVQDLDMGWNSPDGSSIAWDTGPEAWSIAPIHGPLCAPSSGEYELVVSVERGQGAFAVQVWRVAP